jgi:hypothetical protein
MTAVEGRDEQGWRVLYKLESPSHGFYSILPGPTPAVTLSILLERAMIYSFALPSLSPSFSAVAFRFFFRIFPDAFFGMASTKTTPPLNCL